MKDTEATLRDQFAETAMDSCFKDTYTEDGRPIEYGSKLFVDRAAAQCSNIADGRVVAKDGSVIYCPGG